MPDQNNPNQQVDVRIYKVFASSHLYWRVADLNKKKEYSGASKVDIAATTEAASELMG